MRAHQIATLALLVAILALPSFAQTAGGPQPNMPPNIAGNMPPGMRPDGPQNGPAGNFQPGQPMPGQALPGQAAPIPMPNPSVMAQAPGTPTTAPVAAAPTAAATVGLSKKDNIKLADVEDKLIATRDALWSYGDRVRNAELLKQYNDRESKLLPVTAK